MTTLIGALDENASKLLRATDTGAILMIHAHVFSSEDLERAGADVFKLAQMARGAIYVTDAFIDVVGASDLKGLEFAQVWPLGEERKDGLQG